MKHVKPTAVPPPEGRHRGIEKPEAFIAHIIPMSPEHSDHVYGGRYHAGGHTRPWKWIRLANGELVIGFFPVGEGFHAAEEAELDDMHAYSSMPPDMVVAHIEEVS